MPRSCAHFCSAPSMHKPPLSMAGLNQIKHHGSDISLRHDGLAQLESRLAPHNSSFAFDECHVADLLNMHGQHDASFPCLEGRDDGLRRTLNSHTITIASTKRSTGFIHFIVDLHSIRIGSKSVAKRKVAFFTVRCEWGRSNDAMTCLALREKIAYGKACTWSRSASVGSFANSTDAATKAYLCGKADKATPCGKTHRRAKSLRFMEQVARTAKQLANVLRPRRTERGLRQADLVSRIALWQSTVSALETLANVRTATLLSTLAALDVEIVIRPRTKTSARDIEALF
jgi:HTH-type transcriptional regulator / antitoxin HipB